jgi:hypothetical protein
MKKFILALLLSSFLLAQANPPSPRTTQEITHLLAHLENSGCQFNRNGNWYSGEEARTHLNKKYQYLLDKDAISSTEAFIEDAATKSSMSGRPYLVQCQPNAPMESRSWFRKELDRYRQRTKK